MPMDSISMYSNTVYMSKMGVGCGKQFEVAVSLNHDVMTLFSLQKLPQTTKSEPSSVGRCV